MINLLNDWMAYRERERLTQFAAAEKLKISRAALASFESGRTYPKGESMLKIIETIYPGMGGEELQKGMRRDSISCPSCDASVPGPDQGALHCLACGISLGQGCGDCGAVNRTGARFCDECGHKLV